MEALAIILGLIAVAWSAKQASAVKGLRLEIAALRQRLERLGETPRRAAQEPAAAPTQVEPALPRAIPPPQASAAPPAAPPIVSIPAPAISLAKTRDNLEKSLTGRWTVLLGAAVVALGGVFLVKYSVEQGLLGPRVRIALGILLGLALLALGHLARGEWDRMRKLTGNAGYTAPALTAAGIATLFASIYAAFALYHLIPPLLAFVLMAGIAALAVLLSLLHGSFIALLGLAGAYLLPVLIPSDNPSAWGLFGYLAIVTAGCLALVQFRGWWWLAQLSLALTALWTIIWLATSWHDGDAAIIGGFLVLLAGGFIYFTRNAAAPEPIADILALDARTTRLVHVWSGAAVTALLMAGLGFADNYGIVPLLNAAALAALFALVGRKEADFDALAWIGAALVIVVIGSWGLVIRPAMPVHEASLVGPYWIPPNVSDFVTTALAYAVLIGGGYYWLQWGARRPWVWAAAVAVTPVVFLAIVYWRLNTVAAAAPWGGFGLALSAINLLAAWHTAKARDQAGMEAALAAYAVATVAALALAATMSLREAWLTVALAIQLPAIAWIIDQTKVSALRHVALVLAGAVLARLLLNPSIIFYGHDRTLVFNWLFYGYGLPCLAFLVSARQFRRRADDLLVMVLDGGGIALGLAFISLEIHHWLGGGTLRSTEYDLAEQSLQVNSWLLVALLLLYLCRRERRLVLVYGWKIVAGLAAAHLALSQLILSNPLLTSQNVGARPIFNILLLAYALPAVFAAAIHREALRQNERQAAMIARWSALILGFAAISLEIRQAFHGAYLDRGAMSDGEAYSYSAAWLIYGCALLGLGIYRRLAPLRLEALGIITLTVAKTFLFDMSNLTGLYRAASFLALGLSLIGIGYLYQRVVFPPQPAEPGA